MARLRTDGETGETTPATSDRRRRPKIIVAIREDGNPDVEALSEEARAKLFDALARNTPEPPEPINPAVVGFALQAIARIEAAIVGPRFELSAEEAAGCFLPPEPLQEQLQAAGARVLDKYSGSWSRWQDEIVLGALLVTWQASAFQALRAERERREASRREEAARAASPPARPAAATPAGPDSAFDYPVMTERLGDD